MQANILVLGTGSLAKSFCYSLAIFKNYPLTVKILGRSIYTAKKVATISNIRAANVGSSIKFTFDNIDWTQQNDLENKIASTQPELIFHVSSLQSPWEFCNDNSQWGELVKLAGFGITLPLQALLAVNVAKTIKNLNITPILINACYPDAVNPLLKSMGLNISCGIGNISILSSALEAFLPDNGKLKVLAHHFHVGSKLSESPDYSYPKVWTDTHALPSDKVKHAIAAIHEITDSELNNITGLNAAKVSLAFFNDVSALFHVPGPQGLPGGYPVIIANKEIKLDLPSAVSKEEAILWNQECAKLDGVLVDQKGNVFFNELAVKYLKKVNYPYACGFNSQDIYSASHELVQLRERLQGLGEPGTVRD